MSDRQMHSPFTQLSEAHLLVVNLLPAGTAAPTVGEGDPNGSYVTPARLGVGVYTLTTTAPYPAGVAGFAQAHLGTPALVTTDVDVDWVDPSSGDYRIVMTISCFNGSGALELDSGSGDSISVALVARNTVIQP